MRGIGMVVPRKAKEMLWAVKAWQGKDTRSAGEVKKRADSWSNGED